MYGIVKGLGYVWVGFGLGGKDDDNRKELGSYLRKFKIPFWSFRRPRLHENLIFRLPPPRPMDRRTDG